MDIKDLKHSKLDTLEIREQTVTDVKISEGTVEENNKTHIIKLKVFKYNGRRYCCIEQDAVDGRFIEVTPKFYDVIDQLNE